MKKVILSLGVNIEINQISSLLMNIEKHLEKGEYAFEAAIAVFTNEVHEKYQKLFKSLVKYMSGDLGMIINVYFHSGKVSTSTLDIVENCDRFFFCEGCEIERVNDEFILSPEAAKLNSKLHPSKPAELVKELKYIGLEPGIMNQRSLYFGLDQSGLADDGLISDQLMSGYEVLGDVDAFYEMQNYVKSAAERESSVNLKSA